MNRFYILVGSNINPKKNIEKGLKLLNASDFVEIEAASNAVTTKPIGMEGDDFVNQVLRCKTDLKFKDTLHYLKKVESKCGRVREAQNKFISRTLDLDIICWNDYEGTIEGYKLPDPDIERYHFIKMLLDQVHSD